MEEEAEETEQPEEEAEGPRILGDLDVQWVKARGDARLPKPPIAYTLVFEPEGGGPGVGARPDTAGGFILPVEPGKHRLTSLMVEAQDLSVQLPLATEGSLVMTAPRRGCVYVGQIKVFYGRLPRGSLEEQSAIVEFYIEEAAVEEGLAFVYHHRGGVILAGAEITLPKESKRVEGSEMCTVRLPKIK